VCIATASPVKFEKAVTSAGLTPDIPDSVRKLFNAETRCYDMEKGMDWSAILKDAIVRITDKLGHVLFNSESASLQSVQYFP
jgi:hypothetical protein